MPNTVAQFNPSTLKALYNPVTKKAMCSYAKCVRFCETGKTPLYLDLMISGLLGDNVCFVCGDRSYIYTGVTDFLQNKVFRLRFDPAGIQDWTYCVWRFSTDEGMDTILGRSWYTEDCSGTPSRSKIPYNVDMQVLLYKNKVSTRVGFSGWTYLRATDTICSDVQFLEEWNSGGIAYSVGDCVWSYNYQYICILTHTSDAGKAPNTSTPYSNTWWVRTYLCFSKLTNGSCQFTVNNNAVRCIDNYFTRPAYDGQCTITLPGKDLIISGTVLHNGNGLVGVVMNGLPTTPITDDNGYYLDKVCSGFSSTVIPTKTGYEFSPPSRSYSAIKTDQTNENYTASAV